MPMHERVVSLAKSSGGGIVPASHALSCRGLNFNAGGKALVEDISLEFYDRGITAIMGFNGAGKSLLLRLLHGLIEPAGGTVSWEGRPMDADLRARQAMVFQKPVLLRRSVAANVDFVLKARGAANHRRRDELLDHVGLAGLGARPARLLSGGEQQRLALARALACEPDVLFLDEATASLDPSSIFAIEAIVNAAAARGTKIIMITHDVGQARRLASEIVFLHAGKVAEQADADAFFAEPVSTAARAYLNGQIPDAT